MCVICLSVCIYVCMCLCLCVSAVISLFLWMLQFYWHIKIYMFVIMRRSDCFPLHVQILSKRRFRCVCSLFSFFFSPFPFSLFLIGLLTKTENSVTSSPSLTIHYQTSKHFSNALSIGCPRIISAGWSGCTTSQTYLSILPAAGSSVCLYS